MNIKGCDKMAQNPIFIEAGDFLNEGREKINDYAISPAHRAEVKSEQALSDANRLGNEAKGIANQADQKSELAVNISENTENRLDNIIAGEMDDAEVIDARKPFGETPAHNLGERLDQQFGKNIDFRPEVISMTGKMMAEFTDRSPNARWLGITDSAEDQTRETEVAINSGKSLFFPMFSSSLILNEVNIKSSKKLEGNQTRIKVAEVDKRAFYFFNTVNFIEDIVVKGFCFSQPDSSDPGSGMANNHAVTSFLGTLNANVIENHFKNISLGLTFQFGEIGLGDRQGKFNLAAFNMFTGIEKMALENIGTAYNKLIGNSIDGQGANSHGIRITGYGDDHINTKGEGIVGTSNVINGMANAYSLQNTAKFNSFSSSSSNDISFALIDIKRPTVDDNAVEFNSFKGLTFKNVKNVVAMSGGQYNDIDVIGKEVSGIAIEEYSPGQGLNPKGHNRYRATIKDIQNSGVIVRQNSAILDLDLINVQGTGVTISSDANYVTGQIKIENANIGLNLLGNNCILDVHVMKCSEVSGSSVAISGKNNVITVNTDKNVIISGENNTITGYIGGTISQVAGRGTHNISGVMGYSTRKQAINQTTDGAGCVTIQHNLKTELAIVNANMFGSSSNSVVVKNVAGGNVVFEFRKSDGSLAVNTSVSFFWMMNAV